MIRRIDIITVLPDLFDSVFQRGVIGRGVRRGDLCIHVHDLHRFASDRHGTVDDKPYGGGAGMVLKPEPLYRALLHIRRSDARYQPWVVYLSPQGRILNQRIAASLARRRWLVLIAGRYEGIDERVMRDVDEELSIGDYILTGGEFAAMVVVDAVGRYAKGIVKEKESLRNESFIGRFLDHPHYTRPPIYRRMRVPEVLLSGDHRRIEEYRLKESIRATFRKRPELLEKTKLNAQEKRLLEEIRKEERCHG